MADKKITEVQLRDNVSSDVNFPSDDGIQSYRVTAAQIKEYVLSLASIATSMIQDLAVTTGKIAAGAVTDAKTSFTPPTIQRFTSGTGTYTTPAGVKWIKVRMVGGGGGSSYSGTTASNGFSGNPTTFGTSLLTCTGGQGGIWSSPQNNMAGGSYTCNSPAILVRGMIGGQGGQSVYGLYMQGGLGGGTMFGPPVPGSGTGNHAGFSPSPNTGCGAGGASNAGTSTSYSGAGGGGGGSLEAIILSPSSTYSYTVGTGGAKGTSGNGYSGAAGAGGCIEVEEYYQ